MTITLIQVQIKTIQLLVLQTIIISLTNEYIYIMKYKQTLLFLITSFYILRQAISQTCSSRSTCDPRCNGQCAADYDQNYCCHCLTSYLGVNHFFWDLTGATSYARCAPTCPTKFWPNTGTTPYYQCSNCHTLCQTCTAFGNTNCVTCIASAYSLGMTTCQSVTDAQNTAAARGYVANPCNPPYYGIYLTRKCQPCPTGCASCAIFLGREMPSSFSFSTYSWTTNCTGDTLCTYALKCYTCTSAYVLEEGQCITRNRCRKYSMYNSTTSGFNSAYCYCRTGFYLSGVTSCSICDWSCKTCTGPSSNQCTDCHTGAIKNGTICQQNSTYAYIQTWNGAKPANTATIIWTATMASNGSGPVAASETACDSANYVFGYYGYNTASVSNFGRATLQLYTTSALLSSKHYGIHFKAKFLFIDDWVDGMNIIFSQNTVEQYSYRYAMQGLIGEYFCGRASHDHFDWIQFTFPHNRNNNVSLKINVPYTGFAWGIQDVVIGILKCDPSCLTCDGPTQYDCLTCDTNQVLVDGDCVCDSDNGYYNDTFGTNTCVDNCTSNNYMNPITRTCTTSCVVSGVSTYLFKYRDTATSRRYCVQNCPNNYWKMTANMSCVSDCYDSALADNVNYYNFDGEDKICYQNCPDGYYGDPISHYCVTLCPLTPNATDNINAAYYVQNKICVLYCSSTKYAYHENRTCLSSCPNGYYKNLLTLTNGSTYGICEDQCSVTLGGTKPLGDNTTGWCVVNCPDGSYGDYTTHICMDNCNASAFKQAINVSGTIVRTCETTCNSANYSLYGNRQLGQCVDPKDCEENKFGDPITTFCESNCSAPNYGDNRTQMCLLQCNDNAFKQNYTRRCVKTCPYENYQGLAQWGDHYNQDHFCVLSCQSNTYADFQYNRECRYVCNSTAVQTFGLNNMCVFNCSSSTWGDPNYNRTCVSSCTWSSGGIKSYGENQTRLCVTLCPDTTFSIVISTIPLCVYICQARATGMFGNPDTNQCVDKCPSPYYGDPTGNRTCVQQCPDNYFAQNTTAAGAPSDIRICVTTCDYGWADNITRKCATSSVGCSEGTYAHETNHKCVLPINCTGFADPVSGNCVPTCFFNSTVTYYGDNSTKMCVLVCPDDPQYYGDNHTHQCGYICSQPTLQVRDPQYYRRCVTDCSRTPVPLYFDVQSGYCESAKNCTAGTYADNSTTKCQANCQDSLYQYADPVSGECVIQCQLGWYGYNTSANDGHCVQKCPLDRWADNLTVLCMTRCSALTYGVNYTGVTAPLSYGICQQQCPQLQYARDTDNICVPNCGPDLWGNNQTNRCVTSPFDCPNGTYADNQTHMCLASVDCSIVGGIQYVADNSTQSCVPECPDLNLIQNWADMDKLLCVARCPHGYFGFNNTKVCLTQCRDNSSAPWVNQFADPQLQMCVNICSIYPTPTFGQTTTYTCVQARFCPGQTWAEVQVNHRRCVAYCPMKNVALSIPQKYADNITKSCVTTCPTYFFGDIQRGYGMCVDVCPSTNEATPMPQFSDNLTKTCVTVCPSADNTFGDVLSFRCVLTCPEDYFAQEVPYRHCVDTCANNTWGNTVRRFCQTTPFGCPTVNESHYYADNYSHLCVKTCPVSQNTWGENSTWVCQLNCVTGFKYNITRVCIDICPPKFGGEGSFSDQGMCYFTCMTPNYYRDVQNARSCQPQCSFSPKKYYGDQTTWKCVLACPTYPQYYYAYDPTKICRTDCPSSYMRDPLTRQCVTTCPNNTFYDVNSDSCVQKCPTDNSTTKYYGDDTQTIPACVIATNCPNNHFADDQVGLCVEDCSYSQWKYGKLCVYFCPDGYYGNYVSGFCVLPANCPNYTYAQNYTRTCVVQCNGTFADTTLKICVDVCPTNYYGDPVTRLCSTTCTNNATISLHRQQSTRTCISSCSQLQYLNPLNNTCQDSCSYPYYADRTTQMCISVCPSVPPLFADNHTFACVQECQNDTVEYKYIPDRTCVPECPTDYFRDNITRFCVQECINVTYADSSRGYCVYNCSPAYSLDWPINICVDQCPLPYYRDPTTFKCVTDCPTSPVQYFKAINGSDNYCSLNCPNNQFRDFLTFSCVSYCPPSPPTYADSSSGNCVPVCPTSPDYYANTATRVCVPRCPDGMYAQNITRTCVSRCPNKTDLYGDSSLTKPYCVRLCSSGLYGDPYTLTCVGACNKNPQTYGFDNTTDRICLASCPYPYIADNTTYTCVLYCGSTDRPYLDKASKSCVSNCSSLIYQFAYMPANRITNGTCVTFCPTNFFALRTNNTCVSRCPNGLYGDTTNNTCYANCTLANKRFADPTSNMCVDVCPFNGSYDSYGDQFSRKCVTNCPLDKFTVKDNNTRLCQPHCTRTDEYIDYTATYGKCVKSCPSSPLRFADPVSKTCVTQCSLYSKLYGYTTNRTCVSQCPISGLYANDNNRLCVSASNCYTGTYGLDPERICVQICPAQRDLYADTSLKICTPTCPTNYYADPSTRLCVQTCPQVPALYGKLSNKRCIAFCPDGQFADNQTRKCTSSCSLSPVQQFADNSTYICVQTCPVQPNYFSENITFKCVFLCPSSPPMFADYSTRKCVENCPRGLFQTFADNSTRQCVFVCPNGTFMQNSTGTCVSQCTQGFADPRTKFCIALCPPYYYGLLSSRTCLQICPQATPQLYAQDNTHMCQSACLAIYDTFKDDTTNRCVMICPIDYNLFAEPINRICTANCLRSPMQFADNSTRSCVTTCPEVPALFGQNDTLICLPNCPSSTYADNLTRRCVSMCPSSEDTYGDNSTWTCVASCPSDPFTWADNYTRTCVPQCPSTPDFYADNTTGRCHYNCLNGTFADPTTRMCVETCPVGSYGRNATHRCVTNCQTGQFADHLLRLCVAKCSVDPIFYGNPDIHNCTQQCPVGTKSFGNPLTQQCVKQLSNGKSGCPDYHYADISTRLCVKKCPLIEDTYGDNSTWKCVDQCPGGSVNTFSDNSTMMCVSVCPEYPQYYAQKYSRRCVPLCLEATVNYTGSFADNSTRQCVQICPIIPDYYSDNSTRRCVFYCPFQPLTFADYSTRRCVTTCPPSPDLYGDFKTQRCVLQCPRSESTYADATTRLCVKVCPASAFLFGNNVTLRCVTYTGCQNDSFADNSSRLCVAKCPRYPDTYGDPSSKRCVSICPIIPDLYADPISQQCVSRCPDGSYAENNTRKCLKQCPHHLVNYADNLTNRCVSLCPESQKTYGDNSTKICVLQCPDTPFTYADNLTRKCLKICQNVSGGGWAENVSRVCVNKCPDQSYGDITTRYCVRYCPINSFAYPIDNLCLPQCPAPYFGDNSTWDCVLQCPVSQLFFGQNINRTCTALCPLGTYADSYTQQCVPVCPGQLHDTYAFEDNRTCVHECPLPLYAYPVTWVCRADCPDPYYMNITDHRCYKCPDQCAVCTYPQNCIVCVVNHYLYSGRCLESCPTFPVITYANPNGICGTAFQCTSGYFALNTTKSCVQECPSGFYKNSTLQACDSCLAGCSYCINSVQCITCNSTLALWDASKCYLYCSPLRRYYTNIGCMGSCPLGYYLELVTCLACSTICKSCVVQPQNCLICADGYYLSNNLCVSSCPTNTKAVSQNGKLYCKSCSETDCTVTPLTYEITQYTQDFQYKFRLKFSEKVNITEQIDKVIRIRQKAIDRRVLQTTYLYLDYTIIDYGNGEYVIVLNNFDARENSDLQFSFQITNPQAIISESGQFPEDTRTSFIIQSSDYYSSADYNVHMANYCAIAAILAVILLFLSFFTNHSVWMPVIDFFQMIFALLFINMSLPPNAAYTISKSKLVTLSFLPNMFSSALPKSQYEKSITSTIFTFFGDMIFLRTNGYLFTILLVFLISLLVMVILWKKGKWKGAKQFCKTYLKETLPKRDVHGFAYLFFFPIMVIGFMKMRSYVASTAIQGFSIFASFLFMIPALIVPFYFGYKLFRLVRDNPITCQMLRKAYEYIGSRQVILSQNDIYYFTNDNNQVNLKQRQKPRINQLLILPYPLQTRFSSMQLAMPLVQYFYKLMVAFFLVVAFDKGSAQLFLILLLNLLCIVYFAKIKPYIQVSSKQYNNSIMLHNLIVFSLIIILMIALEIQNTVLPYSTRVALGNAIGALVIYSFTANVIYFIFTTWNWYHDNLWKHFVLSNMFMENYTLQYWDYKKQYESLDKNNVGKTGDRQQFLLAIKLQNKFDALQSLARKDPNSSTTSKVKGLKKKDDKNAIQLRPNRNEELKKQITNMFQTFNDEKQKSHKSLKSSERLSKQDRNKVRNIIFGDKDDKPLNDQYERMKIEQKEEEHESSEIGVRDQQRQIQQQTQYQYEYIDEEYPEGTDMQDILKNCKKGDVVMP